MRGFQLWLNLPAKNKLDEPSYRDFSPAEIPRITLPSGVEAVVIAGQLCAEGVTQAGAAQRPDTEPQLFDLCLPAGTRLTPQLSDGQRVILYVFDGELMVGGQRLAKNQLARLSDQGELELSTSSGARVLFLAGRPINEPIVQYGPFVMNSREEIEQALRDFRDGVFTD
jgi:redox-sensitive bicupin YhaK (pirin superfamily)